MNKVLSFLFAVFTFLLVSCATSVPVTVTRPANLDLNGAKTIAVLPFQSSHGKSYESDGNVLINILNMLVYAATDEDPTQKEAVEYLTDVLKVNLSQSQYLTLIDDSVVKKALESNLKAPVDVYLTGKITQFDCVIDSEDKKETFNGKERIVRYYTKTVNATISYQIIDADTSRVIAYKSKEFSQTSGLEENSTRLPTPYKIIKDNLNSLAQEILRNIQPYNTTLYLSMLKSKSKNSDIKNADLLAKNGMTAEAQAKFYDIYQQEEDFACGYNAAKLLQALGKLEDAEKLMHELVVKTGDKRAISGLKSIQYEISQAEKLKQQQAAQ